MSWKDLIKLDDSIYYIISNWNYIDYPNNDYIDGQNNNLNIRSDYTNIIVKPELIINLLNQDGTLNIGGYLAIICHDSYGDKKFIDYLNNRLIAEGWKKHFKDNRIYYTLQDKLYEFKINDNQILLNTTNLDNKYINKRLTTQLEYELLSHELQISRYYDKVDSNKYKIYYYPLSEDDFVVYKPIKIEDKDCDCIYEFRLNNELYFDNDQGLNFSNDSSKIKYYFLSKISDNGKVPDYVSDEFKKNIYWDIIE